MPKVQSSGRWYPTENYFRTSSPKEMVKAFKQVLDQHYSLVDRVNAMQEGPSSSTKPEEPPPGSGPTDSMLLGLRVAPIDTTSLADGTKLTWVKSAGNFQFK